MYSATEQKLEKFVKDKDGLVTRTNYLGGFQYSIIPNPCFKSNDGGLSKIS
ncbi:hypothetical protein [Flavobacterium collinsii]|uniref:Uncharacterized protein n=1 Tax=Flavobacterium collinsii TaxID=1114861 RepID=A0ABM8KP43_9FLAO|nr:hypothetical protein [Flavobacterium collinsii]CAA9202039.1 hypothetical protein FLACOL7796_04061 [Flavobacterium collinsii]